MPADAPAPTAPDTDARILDAALDLFADLGIKRVTIDDIARAAKVNRATLFRRLGSKDGIVRAAILRETTRVLDGISARVDPIDDPAERVVTGFAITVIALRTNKILVKTLTVDAVDTLPALTLAAGGVLDLATDFVAERILTAAPAHATPAALAGMIVRLVHSLVLTPDAAPRLDTEQQLREFATRLLVPLVLNRY
ncbi:TetR/AcrR family transcriptional regulator [Nocardia otitidiscaviarum]|uniref:TetR/AcrR family transcriptional regulator n=1 Tax=Nocardia otitidiscaviarum TaxID=1823 RepID=UPI001893FCF9|nr:TetR/AcrR family transcriptional regulator [Nocardia otitidiscaviarum]MBF6241905.1 TetR/AcrR family transcriptional regulator [Nocardia otitidiscaviarum]